MRTLILSLALLSCGEHAQEELVGTWTSPLNDVCSVGFTFSDDGMYQYILVCPLVDGRYGYEVVFGYYRATEWELRFIPVSGSCQNNGDADAMYRFADGQLRLVFDGAAYLLTKQSEEPRDTPSAQTYVLGCFNRHGQFTVGALHDVP